MLLQKFAWKLGKEVHCSVLGIRETSILWAPGLGNRVTNYPAASGRAESDGTWPETHPADLVLGRSTWVSSLDWGSAQRHEAVISTEHQCQNSNTEHAHQLCDLEQVI